ncbi:MAG: hypothetical protein K2W91_14160 [Novosphingobium sp.]|nr:hypothetical protein [Novosphingobium sp.]
MARLAQVGELRKAEKLAAEASLRGAMAEESSAHAARDRQAEQRDLAESEWGRLLGSGRPDPGLFSLGAAWLVEQQDLLKSQELNLSIAQNLTEKARIEHAISLAREATINKVGMQARKAMVKHLTERQETQVVDQLIWGANR